MRVTNWRLVNEPYFVLNSFDEANESAIFVSDQFPDRRRPIQNFNPPASGARPRNARYSRAVGSTFVVFSAERRSSSTRSPLTFDPPVSAATQVDDSVAVGARPSTSWCWRATNAAHEAKGRYAAPAVGTTALDGAEAEPVPTPFTAATVNVYDVPAARPETFTEVADAAAVVTAPPGLVVTL